MAKTLIEHSHYNYTYEESTIEANNAGSFQRIAAATELMASNYLRLQGELDLYKRWYREKLERIAKLENQVRAYKGVATKLKKCKQQN